MRETSDLQPKYVGYFGISLVVVGVIVFLGVWWMFRTFYALNEDAALARSVTTPQNSGPPEPRLQVSPEQDNQRLIEQDSEILNRYGWVDQQKGIARIPIDRAMQILAERGVK